MGGLILSSPAHPLLLAYIGVISWRLIVHEAAIGTFDLALFALDFISIAGSYLAFILLGRIGMTFRERLAVGAALAADALLLDAHLAGGSGARCTSCTASRSSNKTAHRPARSRVQHETATDAA